MDVQRRTVVIKRHSMNEDVYTTYNFFPICFIVSFFRSLIYLPHFLVDSFSLKFKDNIRVY